MQRPFKQETKTLYTQVERIVSQLPNQGGIWANAERQRQEAKDQGFSNFYSYWSIEDMGDYCPVDGMYCFTASFKSTEQEVTPVLFAKLSATGQELFQIVKAVKEGRLAFWAEAILGDAHPIFRKVLMIADRPDNPFLLEGLGDVSNKDLQYYALALANANLQEFILFRSDNSMAAHIKLCVDDSFRELYWNAFLDVANAYGTSPRSRNDWDSTALLYQKTHPVTMPPKSIKLRLA